VHEGARSRTSAAANPTEFVARQLGQRPAHERFARKSAPGGEPADRHRLSYGQPGDQQLDQRTLEERVVGRHRREVDSQRRGLAAESANDVAAQRVALLVARDTPSERSS
jgi:hypothetical protein